MAEITKHTFVSSIPDGPNANLVRPSDWNDAHAFEGGSNGDLLVRDTADATYGAAWRAPLAVNAMGAFNVRAPEYGAVGDGVENDTSAIQAAIDAAEGAGGGVVFFPPGSYLIDVALTVQASGVWLVGAGPAASRILTSTADIDLVAVGTGSPIYELGIVGLGFIHTGTATEDAAIQVNTVGLMRICDVEISDCYNGIDVTASTRLWVTRTHIYQPINVGIALSGNTSNSYFTDVRIEGDASEPTSGGILLVQCHGCFFNAVELTTAAFRVVPGMSQEVAACFFHHVTVDGASGDGFQLLASSGTFRDSIFDNCWSGYNDGIGVMFNGTNNKGIHLRGCQVLGNGQHGILIQSGSDLSIIGCVVSGNSASSSGSYYGIAAAADLNNFAIQNCIARPISGYANTQASGIIVVTGTSDEYMITGNNARGNVGAGLSDNGSGSNKVVADNLT